MNIVHADFGNIYIEKRGEQVWFSAADVCKVLGYANSRDAVKKHVPTKHADVANRDIRSENGVLQKREVTLINEPGLYRLILRSRMLNAERFTDWVTEEVLPSIRKQGYYSTAESRKENQKATKLMLKQIDSMLSPTDISIIAKRNNISNVYVINVLQGRMFDVRVLQACFETAARNRKLHNLFYTVEGVNKLQQILNEASAMDALLNQL